MVHAVRTRSYQEKSDPDEAVEDGRLRTSIARDDVHGRRHEHATDEEQSRWPGEEACGHEQRTHRLTKGRQESPEDREKRDAEKLHSAAKVSPPLGASRDLAPAVTEEHVQAKSNADYGKTDVAVLI